MADRETLFHARIWRIAREVCDSEGVGPFAGLRCIDNPGHEGGHLYAEPVSCDPEGLDPMCSHCEIRASEHEEITANCCEVGA